MRESYRDPNVWLFEISTDVLEWKSMGLLDGHLTNEIHFLRCPESGALFFSSREAAVAANGFAVTSGSPWDIYPASPL